MYDIPLASLLLHLERLGLYILRHDSPFSSYSDHLCSFCNEGDLRDVHAGGSISESEEAARFLQVSYVTSESHNAWS